jgi:hypothetical protein
MGRLAPRTSRSTGLPSTTRRRTEAIQGCWPDSYGWSASPGASYRTMQAARNDLMAIEASVSSRVTMRCQLLASIIGVVSPTIARWLP